MLVPTVYFSVPTVRRCHCHLSKRQLISSIRMKIWNTRTNTTQPSEQANGSSKAQASYAVALHSYLQIFFSAGFKSVPVLYICMQWLCFLYIAWNSGLYRYSNSFQWYARPGGANHWWEKSPTSRSTHLTGTSLSINLILMMWLYYTILYYVRRQSDEVNATFGDRWSSADFPVLSI